MATPIAIVAYLALFVAVGFLFLFANLLIGRLLRPRLPNKEKLEVYECGEPVIGSSFVQFDLRFYVVALLFIIFDVEVAFFFPWATVFGKATQLSSPEAPVVAAAHDPTAPAALSAVARARFRELGMPETVVPGIPDDQTTVPAPANGPEAAIRHNARRLAWISFADIAVFFAVLMVGFAYVWKRGDLNWVRALSSETRQRAERPHPTRAVEPSTSILSA